MSSVDVIVPCYRYGHFLRECVESVLSQDVQDLRVLILDDASPDNTAAVGSELSKEDKRVSLRRHPTNKGHIATYNEGIDWASADYMLLLSADDYLLPGALNRAIRIMDEHPEVGFTFGKALQSEDSINEIDIAAHRRKRAYRILCGLDFIELTARHGSINIVPTPTAVVRTDLHKRLGGYRSELPHSGDMELWLRLAAHSLVGTIGAHQAVWRRHDANMQLAYYRRMGFDDLKQRKAAIDCFYHACRQTLPKAQHLHRRLLRPLARQALRRACISFSDGEIELSEQLSELALSVRPQIRRTVLWSLLAAERMLGVEVSREIVKHLRKARSSFSLKSYMT